MTGIGLNLSLEKGQENDIELYTIKTTIQTMPAVSAKLDEQKTEETKQKIQSIVGNL